MPDRFGDHYSDGSNYHQHKQRADQDMGREKAFIGLQLARSKRLIRSIGARTYTIANPARKSAAGLVLFISFLHHALTRSLVELAAEQHGYSFLLSNSKPGQYRSKLQAALNRHRFERVCEFGSAVTAHLVGLTLQGEDTAEVHVVAPKEEIEDSYDGRHEPSYKPLVALLGPAATPNCSFRRACLKAVDKSDFLLLQG